MESPRISTDLSHHELVILVDGHHLYLRALSDILHCNEIVSKGGLPAIELEKGRRSKLERIPVTALSIATYSIILLAEIESCIEELLVKVIEKQRTRKTVSWRALNTRKKEEVYDFVKNKPLIVNVHSSASVFDAMLPDERTTTDTVNRYFKKNVESDKLLQKIDEFLDLAKWGHYDQQLPTSRKSSLIVPWRLKNDYIDILRKHGVNVVQGEKRIRLNNNGPYFQEKGVDVNLTIHALESSNEKKTGNFCLVTNDADYVPLVKKLREKKKNVFLTILDEDYGSDSLKASVGKNMILTKSDTTKGMRRLSISLEELDAMQLTILVKTNIDRIKSERAGNTHS